MENYSMFKLPVKNTLYDRHIEIVSSTVVGLSSMSDESRQSVKNVLSKKYKTVGISIINNISDLEDLLAKKPDLVFLGMKYLPIKPDQIRGPEKIWMNEYLESRGILCTGSTYKAHQLELNKSLAKQRMIDSGLKTSPFYVISHNSNDKINTTIPFPLFIKPTDRGGGTGIDQNSVVNDSIEFKSKIKNISDSIQADSLVEQYLPGREFSVAILKNKDHENFISMPIELVASKNKNGLRMLSNKVKLDNSEVVSFVDDLGLNVKLCSLALSAFHALGARDYGRIDIRLDKNGVPNFLEANLIPSLIKDYGSFPKACMLNIQLRYENIIINIVELAFTRYKYTSLNSKSINYKNTILSQPKTATI